MNHTPSLLTGLFLLVAGIASATAAVVTIPPGLNPGDKYRLVFMTDGLRDATSSTLSDYNDFVTAEAEAVPELLALGVDWFAIGSTQTVNAIDNTGTTFGVGDLGVPIFGLNGVKIVDDYGDLWDANLDTGIYLTPTMVDMSGQPVWTGTTTAGIGFATEELGRPTPILGLAGMTNNQWVFGAIQNRNIDFAFYGISDEITFIPEPSRAILLLMGLGAVLARRRRQGIV